MAELSVATNSVVSPALVGRAGELRRLIDATATSPALVVVGGEAGVGKTRLVSEFATAAARDGRRTLLGRCHRIRESFPLGPVIDAVRGLGAELAGLELSPVAGALRAFLPELTEVLPAPLEPLDDRAAERHRVFRGFVDVFSALGPTVLILEDLHAADDQTGDFVHYLLHESLPDLSVVVTHRNETVAPRVRALAADLPTTTRRADVSVDPLGPEAAGELAAAIMGVETVSAEFAAYLCERTSGLPFAIEELIALLRARGSLVQRRSGSWARRALAELDVPTRIRDSVLERVSHLGDAAARTVEAAAVLQVAVPVPLLVATSQVPGDEAMRGIGEALASGVLTEQDDGIGFRHPLAAQAVYENLPSPRRQLLHGTAAAELAAAEPEPLGQIAHHLRHAGRLDDWVVAAERAADQAFELGDDAEAVRLLEDVLRHAPAAPEQRGRLAVKLGQAAIEASRAHDVTGLLSEVLDEELPAPIRGELRFRLGGLLHDAGTELMRAHQLFADAVPDLDHRPDLKAWAMVVLGIPMAGDRDPAEHRAWLDRALAVVPEIADVRFQVFLLGKIAMVHVPLGDPQWRSTIARVERATNGRPRHRREINAYWSVGTQATYAGHHDAADRLLSAGLEAASGDAGARMERSLRSGLALLRYCRGSWAGLADEAAALVDELAGNPRARIDGQTAAACLALAQGGLDAAHTALEQVIDLADELGGFDVVPISTAALLRLSVARGTPDAGLTVADRMFQAVEPRGVLVPAARALPAVAEAMVEAGRHDDAHEVVTTYAHRLGDLDAPLAPAALEHARGFVRLGAGDLGLAAGHFARAASLYEPLLCPYESAQARELAATSMLAETTGTVPDDSEAARLLLGALATYRDLGADWDAGRARQLARRHGLPVPGRHRGGRRSYGSALSPREREVAELAAKGRTNKEIAAELYLSVNTVARHITTAMRKLGIRSRAAIAQRLDRT